MQVWSLGREDPLEEEMAIHSSILAWRIHMEKGAWWATVHRVTKSQTWLKWLSTTQHIDNNTLHPNTYNWKFVRFDYLIQFSSPRPLGTAISDINHKHSAENNYWGTSLELQAVNSVHSLLLGRLIWERPTDPGRAWRERKQAAVVQGSTDLPWHRGGRCRTGTQARLAPWRDWTSHSQSAVRPGGSGGAVDSKAVSALTSSLTEEQPQEPARPVPCGRRRWEGAPSTEQGRGAGTRGVKVTKESFLEEVSLAFDKSVPGCMTHVQRASHPWINALLSPSWNFILKILFIYLAILGLNCSIRGLVPQPWSNLSPLLWGTES